MSMELQESFRGYIAAQGRRAEQKDNRQLPLVTISRETGAGAVTIARMLAEELDKRGTSAGDPPWTRNRAGSPHDHARTP